MCKYVLMHFPVLTIDKGPTGAPMDAILCSIEQTARWSEWTLRELGAESYRWLANYLVWISPNWVWLICGYVAGWTATFNYWQGAPLSLLKKYSVCLRDELERKQLTRAKRVNAFYNIIRDFVKKTACAPPPLMARILYGNVLFRSSLSRRNWGRATPLWR